MPGVKVKIRKSHPEKSAKNLAALSRISQKVRKDELKLPALSAREKSVLNPKTNTKVTVKLNSAGNLRGINNVLNPPDSEHMKKIRAMRRLYNKQMPVLQCNGCTFASTCPKYQAGYECAFLPFLNAHRVDTPADLIFYMKELCGVSMRRAHQMTLMETLSGSPPSLETTEALSLMFEQMTKLHQTMMDSGAEITVESNDGGIIGKLFGSVSNLLDTTRKAKDNPIDLPPNTVKLLENKTDSIPEAVEVAPENVNLDLIMDHSRDELEHSTGKKINRQPGKTLEVSMSELKKL